MDYFSKYKSQVTTRTLLAVLMPVLLILITWVVGQEVFELDSLLLLVVCSVIGLAAAVLSAFTLVSTVTTPMQKLEEIIGYAAHSNRGTIPPNIDEIKLGRELVTAQSLQIYDLASEVQTTSNSVAESAPQNASTAEVSATSSGTKQVSNLDNEYSVLDAIATPMVGVDDKLIVTVANSALCEYVGKNKEEIIGKPLYDSLQLSFQGDETFDVWLHNAKNNAVTASRTWERVRHVVDRDNFKQFDMVVSFSSGTSSGTEVMLALFDRTKRYSQDDQEVSYVALAVHELRTPLTIMRGYIEVFEDELGPTLTPELTDFMHKMHASAQQLSEFVSNILNIARVEEDQLALKLRKESIQDILQTAVSDLEMRARVHGKHIDLQVDMDLPAIAADRISLHEVINNLVDNAIKYSGDSDTIIVSAQKSDQGLVQVNIQDFGIGIPSSVMNELFQKFHRSHRSRVQITGTGLGLYLSKAIVNAHGGNIWVRSKEREGSIFSFTIIPYDQMSEEQLEGEDGIIRGAHGWIKNHSLYRN